MRLFILVLKYISTRIIGNVNIQIFCFEDEHFLVILRKIAKYQGNYLNDYIYSSLQKLRLQLFAATNQVDIKKILETFGSHIFPLLSGQSQTHAIILHPLINCFNKNNWIRLNHGPNFQPGVLTQINGCRWWILT